MIYLLGTGQQQPVEVAAHWHGASREPCLGVDETRLGGLEDTPPVAAGRLEIVIVHERYTAIAGEGDTLDHGLPPIRRSCPVSAPTLTGCVP
jgi:hypothetical protein